MKLSLQYPNWRIFCETFCIGIFAIFYNFFVLLDLQWFQMQLNEVQISLLFHCYFSNVMATNFWSIVLTRSRISRHLKSITKTVVSIFDNVAFLEQFWLQIGNNIPLKTPGNLAVGDFDKNNKKYKKESSNFRLWIYSSASKFLILWTEKRATKNCDKSNAKGFRLVPKL